MLKSVNHLEKTMNSMDGYVPSPYVKTKAPSSLEIQALMNKAEQEYVTWRQTRKPIRHPNVSQKVNSPLKPLVVCSPSGRNKYSASPAKSPSLKKEEELTKQLEELQNSPVLRIPLLQTTCSSLVLLGISGGRNSTLNHPTIQKSFHGRFASHFSVSTAQIMKTKMKEREEEQAPNEAVGVVEGGGHQSVVNLKTSTAPVNSSMSGRLFEDLKIEIPGRNISTAGTGGGHPQQEVVGSPSKLHLPPELEEATVDYTTVNMNTHDGKKHIQEHLYDFYTRQVFCIYADTSASSNGGHHHGEDDDNDEDEEEDEQVLLAEYQQVELLRRQTNSTRSLIHSTPSASSFHSSPSATGTPATTPSTALLRRSSSMLKRKTSSGLEKLALANAIAAGYPPNGCLVVDKTSFIPQYEYDAIFESDWQQSNVERIICDAVERKRILMFLKPVYRVLLWHFHFYAASVGLAEGDPFRIHEKKKFLEALNVTSVDLARYNITDTPMDRKGLLQFLLNVARMVSENDENVVRRRTLIADGIEYSSAMKKLVHDHLLVYAQLQEINHFRRVFLSRGPHSIGFESLLEKQQPNALAVFREYARIGPTGEESMTFVDFLNVLHASELITNAQEEARAMRIFLSCLRPQMDTTTLPSSHTGTTNLPPASLASSFSPEEHHIQAHLSMASFDNFMEAICRLALFHQEVSICKGSYDTCPCQMTSEPCTCDYEQKANQYDMQVFYEKVKEILNILHVNRLRRTMRRTGLKYKSTRTVGSLMHDVRVPITNTK